MKNAVFLLLFAIISQGCSPLVTYSQDGFVNHQFPYKVKAQGGKILGDKWALDNWTGSGSDLSQKKTGSYSAERSMDYDNDGRILSEETDSESIFDLKFVHKMDKSVIWAKAHPVRKADEEENLSSIFNAYAGSLGGRGLYAQGSLFGILAPKTMEHVPILRESGEKTVGGVPGYGGVIEIAETAKRTVDPDHLDEIVAVHMAKTRYKRSNDATVKDRFTSRGLLVIGYASNPGTFPEHLKDYEEFLAKIEIEP